MKGIIGIAEVLSRIDNSQYDGHFSLKFVKEDGSIRHIERGQKGHRPKHKKAAGGFRTNVKASGIILIAELSEGGLVKGYKSILIGSIIVFNNLRVKF